MPYCNWDAGSEILIRYHDTEWGEPLHDDRKQFEFLMMEAMQCGLNWRMMMEKREIFRSCFDGFDYEKVALYDEGDIGRIMATDGMIKSPRKIAAIINNARCFQKMREEFGSFDAYLWKYSGGKTILYDRHARGMIPSSNGLSDKIAKELKKRGFKFLGSITVYSHLQACGIINDHDKNCPCYKRINENHETVKKRCDHERDVRDYSDF